MIHEGVKKRRSLFRLEYSHTINIKSDSKRVWELLTDHRDYSDWNSTIKTFKGEFVEGNTIEMTVPEVEGKVFRAKVKEIVPYKRMLWTNGSPVTLLGKRSYKLSEQTDGTTMLEVKEIFSGLFVPLFVKKLPDLTPVFKHFAQDIKRIATAKELMFLFI